MDLSFPTRVIVRLDILSPTRFVVGIDDNGGNLQRLWVNEALERLVLRQPEGGVWPRR